MPKMISKVGSHHVNPGAVTASICLDSEANSEEEGLRDSVRSFNSLRLVQDDKPRGVGFSMIRPRDALVCASETTDEPWGGWGGVI